MKQPVCYKCGARVPGDADFCGACGAPLTMTATAAPLERISAEAFAYREGSDNPDKPIIVVGILMIWVPLLLAALVMTGFLVYATFNPGLPWRLGDMPLLFAGYLILGFWLWVSSALIVKTMRNWLRIRRERQLHEHHRHGARH